MKESEYSLRILFLSSINKNNRNTTQCSKFSAFLKPSTVNRDWRMLGITNTNKTEHIFCWKNKKICISIYDPLSPCCSAEWCGTWTGRIRKVYPSHWAMLLSISPPMNMLWRLLEGSTTALCLETARYFVVLHSILWLCLSATKRACSVVRSL